MGTSTVPKAFPRALQLSIVVSLLIACEEPLIIPGGTEIVYVVLSPPSFPLAVGEVMRPDLLTLNAEGRPIPAPRATWTTSNAAVASVDSLGLVRGMSEGTAQITAFIGPISGSAEVTITAAAVSEWREHSCFVTLTGSVYCWGRGPNGEMGNGSRSSSPVPVRVELTEPAASVSVGASHSCAVSSSGSGYCWGRGSDGQLGNGAVTAVTTPVPPVGDVRFAQLSAGARHTCGVMFDGRAFCWGDNAQGQLGDGSLTARAVPTPVLTSLRFSSISAGARHTCAVAVDGRGWCWGDNRQAQHGNGTLVSSSTPQEVRGSPDFRLARVSAGGMHTCGVHATNGYAYCWGAGQFGQLGDGTRILIGNPIAVRQSLFTEVVAGDGHSCGVSQDQRVLCWGLNAYGQLGVGDLADRAIPDWVVGPLRFSR